MSIIRQIRFLVGVAILAPLTAFGQSASEHIAAGDREYAALRAASAYGHYQAAIAVDSTNAEALGKASRSAVDLGESEADATKRKTLFRSGEQYARRAVAANPRDAEGHFHLARALGRTALSVGVKERVKYASEIRGVGLEALKFDPNHAGALHVLGVWNAEVMRLNGVERFFAKNVLGGKVFSQANWKDAVAYMEKAVQVDPQRLTHKLDLGKIYMDTKDVVRARQMLEAVVNDPATDVNDPGYKQEAAALLKKLK
jgi:tetratricopeptide (TPR) repeat protein